MTAETPGAPGAPGAAGQTPHERSPGQSLPPELQGASDARDPRRTRRKRAITAAIATVAALALVLTGCGALPGLLSSFNGGRESQLPDQLPTGTVESFGAQKPDWVPCHGGMQCARVYAPLDWTELAGERITLGLVKSPATSGHAKGTVFVNPGGPGASGVTYVADSVEFAVGEAVRRDYDVVGWDPRGVGESSPVRCLDSKGMDEFLFGEGKTAGLKEGSDAWIDAALLENRAFGAACEQRTGPLLAHVDTGSTVRDLDMLRAIVGDPKLNYLGYSYGTYIGARYADLFPDRVGRLVLDGAMDPTTSLEQVVEAQTLGFETALRAYVTDCLKRRDCPLSGTVDQGMSQIGQLLARVESEPLRGSDGRPVTTSTFLTAIITPLYSESNWPLLDDLFVSVNTGDAETALRLADFYYDRENGSYTSNSTEAFSAINCLDYPQSAIDPEGMRAQAAKLVEIAPTIGKYQGYGEVSCAGWPVKSQADRAPVTATGAAPILVVGTTGDPATPYTWAESLAKQLESGVLVTFRGEGHTAYGSSPCVAKIVDDYFVEGTVPSGSPVC
ncbi:alpha/beta fold hydrolase [Leucobacter sp. CSA2]|uniref:Alpha/beta fold hydrolase n=1 Tax=Leucobacter edaphi TaxID=2796472 RepID=A0A934QCM1_9MICO|nr:alpha/beta hydrolase [Leucobacter edaphi]MBK0422175.1 alpha/beta fold hydrolase [Leucobacter edaphi]